MDNEYFHLIDTEEKVNWIIEEYGMESIELVLSNMIEEVKELSINLEKGKKAINLIKSRIEDNKCDPWDPRCEIRKKAKEIICLLNKNEDLSSKLIKELTPENIKE